MEDKNFTEINSTYHNKIIISNGKTFFELGDYIIPNRYEMCVEVADIYGNSKNNDSNFEDFEYFYNINGEKIYKIIKAE